MRTAILGLLLVCVSSSAQTLRTVCAAGCTFSLAQLQNAVDASACGDLVEITYGQTATITGALPLVLRNKGCNGSFVEIRGSGVYQLPGGVRVTPADAPKLGKITIAVGPYAVVTNEQGAGWYRFRGLEITAHSAFLGDLFEFGTRTAYLDRVADNQRSQLAHHIEIVQCYVHGDPASTDGPRRGIRANLGGLTVLDSWFENFKNQSGESNAIGGWNAANTVVIRNTYLEAVAITTIWGGAEPNIQGVRATGLWFIGNHYSRPWKYRVRWQTVNPSGTCLYDADGLGEYYENTANGTYWRCVSPGVWTSITAGQMSPYYWQKNVFELKNAWDAYVEGNYFENAWNPAAQNQYGAMFLFNLVDNDPPAGTAEPAATVGYVDIRNNYGRRTPWVASLGSIGAVYYRWHNNITFRSNLFDEIGDAPYTLPANETFGSKWGGNMVSFPSLGDHIAYQNNTFISRNPVEARAMYLYGSFASTPTDNAVFTANITPWNKYGFYNDTGAGNLWNSILDGLASNRNFTRNVVANNQSQSIYARPSPYVNLGWNPDVPTALACAASTFDNTAAGPTTNGSCAFPADYSAVGFVDYANSNYRLAGGSTWKGWGPYGQDPGADVDAVLNSTTGVNAGAATEPPFLSFQVRALTRTQATLKWTYTAYSTASCTVTASLTSDYASPVTATDAGGNRDRTLTLSGLAGNTRYYWRLRCAGSFDRSGITLTTL